MPWQPTQKVFPYSARFQLQIKRKEGTVNSPREMSFDEPDESHVCAVIENTHLTGWGAGTIGAGLLG